MYKRVKLALLIVIVLGTSLNGMETITNWWDYLTKSKDEELELYVEPTIDKILKKYQVNRTILDKLQKKYEFEAAKNPYVLALADRNQFVYALKVLQDIDNDLNKLYVFLIENKSIRKEESSQPVYLTSFDLQKIYEYRDLIESHVMSYINSRKAKMPIDFAKVKKDYEKLSKITITDINKATLVKLESFKREFKILLDNIFSIRKSDDLKKINNFFNSLGLTDDKQIDFAISSLKNSLEITQDRIANLLKEASEKKQREIEQKAEKIAQEQPKKIVKLSEVIEKQEEAKKQRARKNKEIEEQLEYATKAKGQIESLEEEKEQLKKKVQELSERSQSDLAQQKALYEASKIRIIPEKSALQRGLEAVKQQAQKQVAEEGILSIPEAEEKAAAIAPEQKPKEKSFWERLFGGA